MEYMTHKGEFATLQEMRYAYLTSGLDMCIDPGHSEANEWDRSLLHASEVGYCPRMQMLRISGAPEKPQANLTRANEAVMFWTANRLHYLAFEAMEWAGVLDECEVSLMSPPWAGRADAILRPDVGEEETILYDMKTVRGNAMKYSESFPKEAHCLQLGAYATKAKPKMGIIEYVDRSGSMPPIECVIDLEPWREKAAVRMAQMEDALAAMPDLPPTLPESFVAHFTKRRGQPYKDLTSVTYDCSWECGYCSFHHTDVTGKTSSDSPCKPPNHSPILCMKMEKGSWRTLELRPGLEEFLAAQVKTLPIIGGQDE